MCEFAPSVKVVHAVCSHSKHTSGLSMFVDGRQLLLHLHLDHEEDSRFWGVVRLWGLLGQMSRFGQGSEGEMGDERCLWGFGCLELGGVGFGVVATWTSRRCGCSALNLLLCELLLV